METLDSQHDRRTPRPSDAVERNRLASLYRQDILDTAPEAAFDLIVRAAAKLCDVPMAMISFVDETRQWFKAKVGIDATETERSISFCTHAIEGVDPLIVENATTDVRFAANPLVVGEPGIRFYAGAPLRTSDGHSLGTLCVVDRRSRQLDPEQVALLCELADHVVSHLELRSINRRLLTTMSARDAAEEQLRFEATHDPLTSLANRRQFFRDLDDADRWAGCSIGYVDLDNFKAVNDQFGHDAGDEVLIATARAIERAIPQGGRVARLGGDEFAVLLPASCNNQIDVIAARIRACIAEPIIVRGHTLYVSASVGFAVSGDRGTAREVLARADRSMYRHKDELRKAS